MIPSPPSWLSSPLPTLRPPLPAQTPPWSPSHSAGHTHSGWGCSSAAASMCAHCVTGVEATLTGVGTVNQGGPLSGRHWATYLLLLPPFYWWAERWSSLGQTALKYSQQSRDFNPDPSKALPAPSAPYWVQLLVVTRSSICAWNSSAVVSLSELPQDSWRPSHMRVPLAVTICVMCWIHLLA